MLGEYIAQRYRVERVLGVGGMSRVLAVTDERSGRQLALKQCTRSSAAADHARMLAWFRNEFHVLSQVVHPNVVAVEEYGFDGDLPFYTMELLEGEPLSQLAPRPWPEVCSIMLDLCSPLAMLHARRFLHGDISARNVLVTRAGVIKLIDFGTLTSMDEDRHSSIVAGTPPHIAPELVQRQPLDGRTDMFALGALAYWLLSGTHAYPARAIRDLPAMWLTPPSALRERNVELPAALDELICSMLRVDAAARPVQIVEVVQRLNTIAGRTHSTDLSIVRAHLTTPTLVGRERLIEVFRALQRGLPCGRGAVLCIRGARGLGHTRAIDALTLEARLSGSIVLRADTARGSEVSFGVVASLVAGAAHVETASIRGLPNEAAEALEAGDYDLARLARALSTPQAQATLEQWWSQLCEQRSVVVLVDDMMHADTPSLQHLLSLAEATKKQRLLLVAAVPEVGGATFETELLSLLSTSIVETLEPFTPLQTERLLRSIFGDAPHLEELATWAHRAAAGSPAACMELAQYLIERDVIRFEAGQFQIPGELSVAGLPQSLEHAVATRIASLSEHARELLGAVSLITPFGPLSTLQHLELMRAAGWSQHAALDALDELLDAKLLVPRGDGYDLRVASVGRRVSAEFESELARTWHGRLAALYERQGHARCMLASWHYQQAGRPDKTAELMLGMELQGPDDPNMAFADSPQCIEMHRTLLEDALKNGAPSVLIYRYRRALVQMGVMSDPALGKYGPALFEQLRFNAGLDQWESADRALDDHAKLLFCLGQAQQRYLSAAASDRGLPVADAVRALAQCGAALSNIYSTTMDGPAALQLTAALRPLRTLGPVLAASCDMIEGRARALTLGIVMVSQRREMLDRLAIKPEGMPQVLWAYTRGFLHFYLGQHAAANADPACLEHVEFLLTQHRLVPYAHSVRMLYALARGQFVEARQHRRQRTIAMLTSGHEDQQLAMAMDLELQLLNACGDLLELQRLCAWYDARSQRFPRWAPNAACARANYLLHCGEAEKAAQLTAARLADAPALEHASWFELRALHAEAVLLAGDPARAIAVAMEPLELVERAGIDMSDNHRPQRVLALASATLGQRERAYAWLTPLLERAQAAPAPNVNSALVYETGARVAMLFGEQDRFERCFAWLSTFYRAGAHPGLAAKLERLSAEARAVRTRGDAGATADSQSRTSARVITFSERVQTELSKRDDREQAEYLLSLILDECGVAAGHLLRVMRDSRTELIASRGAAFGGGGLAERTARMLARFTNAEDLVTRTECSEEPLDLLIADQHDHYLPVPLRGTGGHTLGIALVQFNATKPVRVPAPAMCRTIADALVSIGAP